MSVRRNGRYASLSVSQNFLTSRHIIARIVSLAHIQKQDHVIEIGPGKSHITRELARWCRMLTAIELDPHLVCRLSELFAETTNVRILHQDFLKTTLPAYHDYTIFSNILFSITTPIVVKMTEARNLPKDAWLVMEKGAAMRFMGRPVENVRSLALKPYFDCAVPYHFKRENFHQYGKYFRASVYRQRKCN